MWYNLSKLSPAVCAGQIQEGIIMTFCTYCGKQLQDGEVCTCQQNAAAQQTGTQSASVQEGAAQPQADAYVQPQPQVNAYAQPQAEPKNKADVGGGFKALLELFKKTIKTPFEAAEEFYRKSDLVASIIAIAMIAGLYTIATMLNFVAVSSHYLRVAGWNSSYKILGYSRWDILKMVDISIVDLIQSIFFPVIWVGVMTGAIIGLSILVNKVILKKSINIKGTLSLCASVSVPLMAALTVKIISNFIYVDAFANMVFPIITVCLGFLTLLQGLNIISKEIQNRNKLLIVLAIGVAGLIITNYLLDILVMNHCQTTFSFPM